MQIFKITGLMKDFSKTKALKDINLDLQTGEILGFLGPNGAGKSTTIRVILGMLKKSGGEISLFEKDPWKDSAKLHEDLVYVPGEVNLWPSLTGGETIDFLAKLSKVDVKSESWQKNKTELAQKFALDMVKKCKSYSKGNKQKVALISALAIAKTKMVKFVIFDEPTSGFDPLMEEKFVEEAKKLKELGMGILLSSHILSEVEKLCDRVAIVKEGVIVKTGTIEQIREEFGKDESFETAFLENYESDEKITV